MSKKARLGDEDVDADVDVDADREEKEGELKFAMVCSSNMNRSMEAHKQLKKRSLQVESFGVGAMVRLPGPNGQQAVFEFGTPYREIYNTLVQTTGGGQWYRNNGLLDMVERNIGVKHHPERWQDLARFGFQVVFCFEERVFELLMEDVYRREVQWEEELKPMHVFNLEVLDNPKEAAIGAQIVLEFCERANAAATTASQASQVELSLVQITKEIEQKYKRSLLHSVVLI